MTRYVKTNKRLKFNIQTNIIEYKNYDNSALEMKLNFDIHTFQNKHLKIYNYTSPKTILYDKIAWINIY